MYVTERFCSNQTLLKIPLVQFFKARALINQFVTSDENGIIMGEFGFITADGIYHVTVYATDENGDFKILKMKNIKVGFREFSSSINDTLSLKVVINKFLIIKRLGGHSLIT